MKGGTVCSGIGAPEQAMPDVEWIFSSEIEAAPAAVHAARHGVPNWGDMTKFQEWPDADIDILVGGTPCQSFSVAGLRGGLADPRGNLALTFLAIAARYAPRWILWENVPGVLSSNGGRDFGAFLGGLGQCGYGWAYRVLDAQHFGIPQRRRRVFVVGYLGDWRRAAAVLFERHCLQGHPAPRREARQAIAGCLSPGAHPGGFNGQDAYTGHLIAHSLRAEGFDASEDGTGRGTPIIPIDMRQASRGATMTNNRVDGSSGGAPGTGIGEPGDPSPTISTSHAPAICFSAKDHGAPAAMQGSAVRRLTPRECERLQGFPEVQKSYTILLCRNYSDQQKSRALAALQSRKSPSNVWTAGASGWTLSAEAAEHYSSTSHAALAPPVVLDALLDLERTAVAISSRERSFSLAPSADGRSEFPLPTGIESFAHLAALTMQLWEKTILAGRAASPANITPSIPHWNGNSIALEYGREIERFAADAGESIAVANRFITSTTSPSGHDIQTFASTLKTLSCCVAHAIAGFIPERTQSAPSFAVRLTTTQGFTLVPYRNGMMADGPRYKMLGNSMAVPVVRWIGERIMAVEAIVSRQEAA